MSEALTLFSTEQVFMTSDILFTTNEPALMSLMDQPRIAGNSLLR